MAEIIVMPKLGFNQEEGELVKWHKQVGNPINKGDLLFETNTDKTTMPVEATRDGILLKILVAEGEAVPVFTPIAVVGDAGEDADAALSAAAIGQDASGQEPDAHTNEEPASEGSLGLESLKAFRLSPKAQKLMRDRRIEPACLALVTGTGFQGGITARDILLSGVLENAAEPKNRSSPLARKVAEEHGIDLASVTGTGIAGKIMCTDVEQAIASPCVSEALSAHSFVPAGPKVLRTAPYNGLRKIIGDRLSQSLFTAPHLYFTENVDMGECLAFRKRINELPENKVAMSDLLIKAVSKSLQKYPNINASLHDGTIVTYQSINIGMAVAGDKGLIVPVVKDTQEKPLSKIASETRDLVERAKSGTLVPEEYSGGTFSISNLGMFGIENFTAIINPPEAAILAVSSVRKKAVITLDEHGEDAMAIRPMMSIQLSVDHRLIDGLLAVQFLACLKDLLEHPLAIVL
ncbi:dihydrolipoamide acetyltransferase family protein [Bilophila wadsworthia]|uniref:dihydrolipoamide acetyltransferase family protein n=1 Tax=Bilophila wadsworthia TaxID=35833 RepID=UPI003AB12675